MAVSERLGKSLRLFGADLCPEASPPCASLLDAPITSAQRGAPLAPCSICNGQIWLSKRAFETSWAGSTSVSISDPRGWKMSMCVKIRPYMMCKVWSAEDEGLQCCTAKTIPNIFELGWDLVLSLTGLQHVFETSSGEPIVCCRPTDVCLWSLAVACS